MSDHPTIRLDATRGTYFVLEFNYIPQGLTIVATGTTWESETSGIPHVSIVAHNATTKISGPSARG